MTRKRSIFPALLAAVTGAAAGYWFIVRPWHRRWGATDEEVKRQYPGDDLIGTDKPKFDATHAITIDAPPSAVWPWLVQMGQGRGGFYSHDWIENAMDLDIHSADRIHPEWQSLREGDEIPLAQGFGVPVAILEPERTLVLHGDTRVGETPEVMDFGPGEYLAVVWSWHLSELPGGNTRLVERWLVDYNESVKNSLFYSVFLEPGAFIMEHGMLKGLKQRVESSAQKDPVVT